MKNVNPKFILSALALYSILFTAITAQAAPVRFNQVVQVIDAKPGKAGNSGFAKLQLANPNSVSDDDKTKTDAPKPQQDDRVITETKSEIVENDVCDCVESSVIAGGFPYGWLALGGVPFLFLIPPGDEPNSSPSPTPPPGVETPTPTPSTPTPTPTPTPMTPTPTPTTTPTPEPVTILLFGTGLAGVGLTARRKFGKKDKQNSSAE